MNLNAEGFHAKKFNDFICTDVLVGGLLEAQSTLIIIYPLEYSNLFKI